MKFLYLRNLGSPTRWDAADYFQYRDRDNRFEVLSPDLLSMISDDRYRLDSEKTFWYAQLVSFSISCEELKLVFQSASGRNLYIFSYFEVKKVLSDFSDVKHMPAMVVQELVLLRNGICRHAFVDMTGRNFVAYSAAVQFSEMTMQ